MKDALLKVSKYLPAAAANNTTDSIDLERTGGAARGERAPLIVVEVAVPALANHTDTSKTITIDLYDSADDVTFAEGVPLIQCKIPGVGSTGSAATTFTFPLPAAARRYIAFKQTVPSGDGDNTAGLVEIGLVF